MITEDNSSEDSQDDTTSTDDSNTDPDPTDPEDDSGDGDDSEDDDADDQDGDEGGKDGEEDDPVDYEPESRSKPVKKDDDGGEAEDDDEDLDPEDAEKINKAIDKKLSPMEARIQKQNDEIEINTYLAENPEFAKYKPAIQKHLAHPSYSNIPVKNIVAMIAAKDMQKLGAKKERAAAKKAKSTKGGGSQVRKPVGGKVDYSQKGMSSKEFQKHVAKAKGQRI